MKKRSLKRSLTVLAVAGFTILFCLPVSAELNPVSGRFTYADSPYPDDTLSQIALYLLKLDRREGRAYLSPEVTEGIVGYQVRFYDDGNQLVDEEDWMSVRRWTIPSVPDTLQEPGYWKESYVEFVDRGLNGISSNDYYFLNGRRFDLRDESEEVTRQYQSQVETAIDAFVSKIDFLSIIEDLGATRQTSVRRADAFEDGSLPSMMVFGLDMPYVFRPVERDNRILSEGELLEEVRARVGFIYSSIMEYTDLTGYRMRDLAEQVTLMQRTYDPMERAILDLILGALFDLDGDGIVEGPHIQNGYTRYRELHQQAVESARSQGQRIVLPNNKLERLRKEYEQVRGKPFEM